MNRDSPDDYIEPSVEASIAATTALIAHIRSLPDLNSPALVQPVLTPRFAISCTPPLLSSLGSLAREDPTLLVQTHIGENQSEIAYTKTLFPECRSYADVYDHYGLLGRRTVLAHAVYLEEEEVQLLLVTQHHGVKMTALSSQSGSKKSRSMTRLTRSSGLNAYRKV